MENVQTFKYRNYVVIFTILERAEEGFITLLSAFNISGSPRATDQYNAFQRIYLYRKRDKGNKQ